MTCLPCNNDCRQGRDCPATRSEEEERTLRLAFIAFAAPILIYVVWGLASAMWLHLTGVV